MDQIVKELSARLGLPESEVRKGIGILLGFLKQKAAGTEFEKLLAALPGAGAAMAAAPSADAGGGLGGLLGAATSLLGGQAGELGKIVGSLQGAGITADKVVPLATGFLEQARQVAGADAVEKVLASAPGLAELLTRKA